MVREFSFVFEMPGVGVYVLASIWLLMLILKKLGPTMVAVLTVGTNGGLGKMYGIRLRFGVVRVHYKEVRMCMTISV